MYSYDDHIITFDAQDIKFLMHIHIYCGYLLAFTKPVNY